MFNRRRLSIFREPVCRELVCLLLSTTLIAAPVLALPVRPQPVNPVFAALSLSNFRAQVRNWMPSLFLSPYAKGAALQTGTSPNLDTLRGTTPQPPLAYTQDSLPAASYLDPKPTNNANLNYYFTQLTEPNNPSGPIGALPMQVPDPTAGASMVGGLSVDMITKNFNWTAPVMSLAGRAGLNLSLALSYSSNVWIGDANNVKAYNMDRGFPGPGWRIGFGSILWENPPNVWGHVNQTTLQGSVMYLAPDGTRHTLKNNPANGRWESYDSTYLSLDLNTGNMTTASGTKIHFGAFGGSTVAREFHSYVDKITDRNGNFITISYKTLSNESFVPDYAVDTAGRRIDFEYTNNRLTGVKQMRGATPFYYVRIDHTPVTIQGVTGSIDPPGLNGAQVWLPSKLTYPTGMSYRFTYSAQGVMNSIAKWVPTITGQGNARPVAGCDSLGSGVRREWAENWPGNSPGALQSYVYTTTPSGGWEVINPNNTRYIVYINGNTYTSSIVQGYTTGQPSKITYTTYALEPGLSYRSNPRVVESKIVDTNAGGATRRVLIDYQKLNGVWLPSAKVEYAADAATAYRTTFMSYLHYPAQGIIGLPYRTEIYSGTNVKIAESENIYDETGSYTDSNNQAASYFINATADNVIQHDNTNYGASFTARGNLTRTLQFNGGTGSGARTVKYVSYDTNGNVRARADGAKNRSQIDYTDNYSNKPTGVGATGVYPYTAANPVGFRGGALFNYYTGQTLQSFNLLPGGSTPQQVVTTSYDFADRPLTTTRPDGGQVGTQYWDNYLALGTRQLVEGAYRFKWDIYDGAGRAYKKAADHPDAITQKFSGQITAFNNIGEVTDTSNTIAINGNFQAAFEDASPGFLFTHLTYDSLGRLEEVMKPDNNHVDYDREGCGCAGNMTTRVTDELGVVTESKTDFLGRLKEAKEPISSWQDYSRAEYTYNELDQLIQINHFGSSSLSQVRWFNYDGYGRLYSEYKLRSKINLVF